MSSTVVSATWPAMTTRAGQTHRLDHIGPPTLGLSEKYWVDGHVVERDPPEQPAAGDAADAQLALDGAGTDDAAAAALEQRR